MKFLTGGNPLTREAVVFAIFIGILLFGALLVLVFRTRSLPVCWNCGFSRVHRAHSNHRPIDAFARVFFLYPHKCQRCLHRAYCFGSPRVHRPSATKVWLRQLNDGQHQQEGKHPESGPPQSDGRLTRTTDGSKTSSEKTWGSIPGQSGLGTFNQEVTDGPT